MTYQFCVNGNLSAMAKRGKLCFGFLPLEQLLHPYHVTLVFMALRGALHIEASRCFQGRKRGRDYGQKAVLFLLNLSHSL